LEFILWEWLHTITKPPIHGGNNLTTKVLVLVNLNEKARKGDLSKDAIRWVGRNISSIDTFLKVYAMHRYKYELN